MSKEKIIASIGLCNCASINIYGFEYGIDDYIIAGLNDDKPRKYKIYSNTKGSYFNYGKHRYYLNEVTMLY